MSPYETDPELVPTEDPYLSRSVHYGRYTPCDADFRPSYDHWCETDPDPTYWEGVVRKFCTPENSLNIPGTREAFAAGSVIIRVDRNSIESAKSEKYRFANLNELRAARKAEDALKELGVAVPVIYFCGPVEGKNVTVESRIPGVSLEVAWRYLTTEQVNGFKEQCRRILQRLGALGSSDNGPSYVCHELNGQSHPDSGESERDILFEQGDGENSLYFTHNDMTRSNIIVKDDRIVGLLGWRQSGFFGLEKARKIHQQLRVPEPTFISSSSGQETLNWGDLYDGISTDAQSGIALNGEDTFTTKVKTEPTSINLDKLPMNGQMEIHRPVLTQLDGTEASDEYLTPKKITDLKQGVKSRASSSERSSPATSTKVTASSKKTASTFKKKGTAAKKPATKKRKRADQDGDSVDGRSNTPLSTRTSKTPASKKQSSVSVAGSPVPESKKQGPRNAAADEGDEDDDFSDANEVFCICRKPDNHTWMIACDGVCEDWFHGKCVNIDSKDADLIDRYICPNCSELGHGFTTWKPMCRLPGCRKPARVSRSDPSKYCSDEHGREFMRQKTRHLNLSFNPTPRKSTPANRVSMLSKDRFGDGNNVDGDPDESHAEDEPGSIYGGEEDGEHEQRALEEFSSRGGVLTAGELKAAIMGVSSIEEFRKLGERIISPPPDEEEEEKANKDGNVNEHETTTGDGQEEGKPRSNKKLGLDIDAPGLTYTLDEASKIEKLRKKRDELLSRKEMLDARSVFLTAVRQRAKYVLEHLKKTDPKGGWKDICGFDSRFAWSDEEFDEWRLSPMGAEALKDGTPDALAASYPVPATDADGDTAMGGDANTTENSNSETLIRGVCTKKRCERHKQWVKVQQQDILFEQSMVHQDLTECEQEAQAVVERAVLRMWAEKDNYLAGGE